MEIIRREGFREQGVPTMPLAPLSFGLFAAALVMVLMPQTPLRLLGWALLLLLLPWLPLGAWMADITRLPFTAFLILSTLIGFAFSPLLLALGHMLSFGSSSLVLASLLCHLASVLILKRPASPRPRFPQKIAFPLIATIFILLFASYITLPLWGAGQENPGASLIKPIVAPNQYRTFTKLFTMDYLGRVSNILELTRGTLPPRVPYLASERWPFHWFWFLIAADLSTLGGVSAFFINKSFPTTCIILFLASLYHVSKYLEKKYLFIAAVLLFSTFLASYEHFGLPLHAHQQNISWASFFFSPGNAEEGLTDCYNSLIHNYIFSNHGLIVLSLLLWSLISLTTSCRSLQIVMGMMLGLGVMYHPLLCLGALTLLVSLLLFELTSNPRRGWLYAALITSPAALLDLRLAPIPLLMLLLGFYRPSLRRSKEILWILVPAGLTAIFMLKVFIGPVPVHGGSILSFQPGLLLLEERRYDLAAVASTGQWGILIAFNLLLCLYLLPVILCSALRCGPKGLGASLIIAIIAVSLLNASPILSLSNSALHVPGLRRLSLNFLAIFVSLLEMGVPVLFLPWIFLNKRKKTHLLFDLSLLGSIVIYILMNSISIHNIHGDFLYKFSTIHRLLLSFLGAYGLTYFVSAMKRQGKAFRTAALVWAAMAVLLALPFTVQFVRWNLDTSTEPLLRITEADAELIAWIKHNTHQDAVIQGLPLRPRKHLGLIVPFMNRRTGYVQLEEISFLKGAEVAEHYRRLFSDASHARTPKQFQRSFRALGVDYICVFDYANKAVKAKLRAFAEEDKSIQKVYSGKAGEVYHIQPEP